MEEIRADEIHEGNMKAGPHPDNTSDTCFFMTKGEHTFNNDSIDPAPISFCEHLSLSNPCHQESWRVYLCSCHLRVNICTTLPLELGQGS